MESEVSAEVMIGERGGDVALDETERGSFFVGTGVEVVGFGVVVLGALSVLSWTEILCSG